MQKKIDHNSPLYFLSDLLLAAFAVMIVAGTYFGLSKLTPQLSSKDRVASVLGANSEAEEVSFIPSAEQLPFISSRTTELSTTKPNTATTTIKFSPLEKTSYSFAVITAKNKSTRYKTVQVNPEFSLPNSYTTISINYLGETRVLVDSSGQVYPLDLSLQPNTAVTLRLIVEPTTAIATTTTLRLVFTELQ